MVPDPSFTGLVVEACQLEEFEYRLTDVIELESEAFVAERVEFPLLYSAKFCQ